MDRREVQFAGMSARKPCPSDVPGDEWALVAPYLAVDTLGHLLALRVTPASADDRADDRAEVGGLAAAVQAATGQSVEPGFADQGYTGEKPAAAAKGHGIALEVVKLPEAKRGFVLLPRRWVVERSSAWAARCRRLARDYGRLPTTLAGLHVVAFARPMMPRSAAALGMVHGSLQPRRRPSHVFALQASNERR